MNIFKFYLGVVLLLLVVIDLALILFNRKKMTNNEVFVSVTNVIIGLHLMS